MTSSTNPNHLQYIQFFICFLNTFVGFFIGENDFQFHLHIFLAIWWQRPTRPKHCSWLGIQSYSQIMAGVFHPLLSIVFRFHCQSQRVIGSLGLYALISTCNIPVFRGLSSTIQCTVKRTLEKTDGLPLPRLYLKRFLCPNLPV